MFNLQLGVWLAMIVSAGCRKHGVKIALHDHADESSLDTYPISETNSRSQPQPVPIQMSDVNSLKRTHQTVPMRTAKFERLHESTHQTQPKDTTNHMRESLSKVKKATSPNMVSNMSENEITYSNMKYPNMGMTSNT